jgi:uncharacterized protein
LSDIDLIQPQNEDIVAERHCVQCNGVISAESRFCKHCGHALVEETVDTEQKWQDIKLVAIFFAAQAIICAAANYVHVFHTLVWSISIDVVLAILAVTFFCNNWNENRTVFNWRSFSVSKLTGYCIIAAAGSVVVSFCVQWLNRSLFSEEFSYYAFYADYKYGKLLAVFFIAVMPALFEELGYRGFVMGRLLNVVEKNQAIFITSFLFAIMHMSFISLFWLIPFALLLGYVRVKENTLWYGVCMHFMFNFTVCLSEFLRYNHRF